MCGSRPWRRGASSPGPGRLPEGLPEPLDLDQVAVRVAHERVVDTVRRIVGRWLDDRSALSRDMGEPFVDLVGDEGQHDGLARGGRTGVPRRPFRVLGPAAPFAEPKIRAAGDVIDAAAALIAREPKTENPLVEVDRAR